MKILFISNEGDALDIALRLKGEGNEVKTFIKDPESRREIYKGLIDKIPAWQPFVSWCDFAIFDHNNLSEIWDVVSKTKPCFGGHEIGEKLEKDREFGHEVMEYIGLKKLESITFHTIKEAQEHLKSHKVRHVVKPFGPKVGSWDIIISEDESGEDAIALLHCLEERKIPFKGIEVEERKIGVEVGISGWFNGNDWVYPININFEHKRFAAAKPEGCGFLTGEMGTVMRYTEDHDNKVFKKTLDKMKDILSSVDYRGQWDLSVMADKDGFWPLEHTPRLGYPAIFIEVELQKTPLTKLFHGLAAGTLKENEVHDAWGIGVVVASYGFPFRDIVKERSSKYPIFNLTDDNFEHVHLVEAQAGFHGKDEPGLTTCEGDGYPMVLTEKGKTIEEAQKKIYKMLDLNNPGRIRVPNSYWRSDIGDRVIDQKKEIIDYGILSDKESV